MATAQKKNGHMFELAILGVKTAAEKELRELSLNLWSVFSCFMAFFLKLHSRAHDWFLTLHLSPLTKKITALRWAAV